MRLPKTSDRAEVIPKEEVGVFNLCIYNMFLCSKFEREEVIELCA
jgi:hypothetical protein